MENQAATVSTANLRHALPFDRILVPYDGSEPARAALTYALAFGRVGSAIDVVNVVDEVGTLASPTVAMATVLQQRRRLERGRELLAIAKRRCRRAGIESTIELLRGAPVPAIIAAAQAKGSHLILLGTHGRTGLRRLVLGSVTEGVLRAGAVPMLAVRSPLRRPARRLFQRILAAVDDAEPSDAAASLAGDLSRALSAACVFAHVIDAKDAAAKAARFGYDLSSFIDVIGAHGTEIVEHARERSGLGDTAVTAIVKGKPVPGILQEADRTGADAIVIGSHGRRGLQRFFLGSVAEKVLRASELPVFVVRCARTCSS
jgi:nucleotide-binding universal stress UspA family protein